MIAEKLFESTKELDDTTLCTYLDVAFSFYMKDLIHTSRINSMKNKFDTKIISSIVRFFRIINITVKLDEDALKDHLKGKAKSLENLHEKIDEILKIQGTKKKFSDTVSIAALPRNLFCYDTNLQANPTPKINTIKTLCDFNWKVNLVISNCNSNKILMPEILLGFSFTDGTKLQAKIPMKVFQEMRKNLTFHIKRILDNEGVTFLK